MTVDFQSTAATIALYIQRTKKTTELPSNRNKIPKPNQKNPKQQQKDKLTGFKLKRNLLLMSVSP